MAKSVYLSSKPAQVYKFGRIVVDGQHRHRDIKKVAQCPATGLYWWRVIGAIYEDRGQVFIYSYRLNRRVMEICTDFDRVTVADVKGLNL